MNSEPIDVARELGQSRLQRFHLHFAALLGAMLFIDGYDLFSAAYVAPYIRAEWSLQPTQIGLMLSIGLAGLALGAVLQGPLSDRWGRRRIMLAAVWSLGLVSLALCAAPDFRTFCALRALLGLCLGMISPLAFVYINEWAPADCGNRFATLTFVVPFSLGGVAAGLVGMAVGPMFGWRALYGVGVLALPVALAGQMALPESVRHLVQHGGRDAVARLLTKARPDRAQAYATATRFVSGEEPGPRPSPLALLGPRYRRLTLSLWAAGALSLFCIHGLTGWLPSIVLKTGADVRTAFGYGSLLMAMQIVGGALGGWLADRHGRINAMVMGFFGGAVALLLLIPTLGSPLAMIMVALTGLCVFGAQAVMNNFISMSYETSLRGVGVGLAVGINRIGGVLGPLLIGWTQQTAGGLWRTLGMLAAAQLLAALIFLWRGEVFALRWTRAEPASRS